MGNHQSQITKKGEEEGWGWKEGLGGGGGGVAADNLNVAGELCMYDHTFLKCYRERFSSPSPPFSRPFRLFFRPPPPLSSSPTGGPLYTLECGSCVIPLTTDGAIK